MKKPDEHDLSNPIALVMSRRVAVVTGAALLVSCRSTHPGRDSAEPGEAVRRMSRQIDGHQLEYLLQTPAGVRPKNGWPLLLFLHGSGERGDDINKVRVHGPPKRFAEFAELRGAVIVSPQCPGGRWWRVKAVKSLVDEVIAARGDIDTSRIYISGLSMGGYGTWSMISQYPDFFAAAVPICGGGNPLARGTIKPPRFIDVKNEFDPDGLRRAAAMPIWSFHGDKDKAVPISETEAIVKLLKDAGGDVKFTVYKDVAHVKAWQNAYTDPELWKWIFSQRK